MCSLYLDNGQTLMTEVGQTSVIDVCDARVSSLIELLNRGLIQLIAFEGAKLKINNEKIDSGHLPIRIVNGSELRCV